MAADFVFISDGLVSALEVLSVCGDPRATRQHSSSPGLDAIDRSGVFCGGVGCTPAANSPRPGLEFVARRITGNAAAIRLRLADKLPAP
jgi:hypothetical protein